MSRLVLRNDKPDSVEASFDEEAAIGGAGTTGEEKEAAETKEESEAATSRDDPRGAVVPSAAAADDGSDSGGEASSGNNVILKSSISRMSITSDTSSRTGTSSAFAMFKRATVAHLGFPSHHNNGQNLSSHHQRSVHGRGKLTEEDEAMLSDSEADYDAFDNESERAEKRLISPNFRFIRWYSSYMLVVLLVFVFYLPIRIAVHPRETGPWLAVDIVWHVLFTIDIGIHLNTGFINRVDGTVVYSRRAIFWHYAKGWLIVDVLAAVPFEFLPGLGPEHIGLHEMAQLLSLPKVFRLYWLMAMAQENHRLHEGAFMAVRTLLSVVFTGHVFGCGWYMLATLLHTECEDLYFGAESDDYIASECPWLYRFNYAELSLGRKYLGSVYWAMTTLTTVGYGDISARTTEEQIYAMVVQIVGVSWYGYIIGTWASVLNSFDRKESEQRSKMREVVAFSKAASLPPDIAKKVRQHFRFSLYRQDNWITYNEEELVSDMPAGLRADVITHVHSSTIADIPWLEDKDKHFVADIALMLKPRLFMMGDVLYRSDSHADEMFFIASGIVMLKYNHQRVGFLRQGQMAGLIGLVSCDKHKMTAVVVKEAHCLGLSQANFKSLVDSYPREMQELIDAANSLAQRIASRNAEAKADFMSNDMLAALMGKPKIFMGGVAVGDRWTEQQDSIGHVPESIGRKSVPAGFSPSRSAQQKQPQQSARTSGPDAPSSSTSAVPSSFTTSLSQNSWAGTGTGTIAEGSVECEVSRRMLSIEDRLGTVMARLDAFLDAAASRDFAKTVDDVPSSK